MAVSIGGQEFIVSGWGEYIYERRADLTKYGNGNDICKIYGGKSYVTTDDVIKSMSQELPNVALKKAIRILIKILKARKNDDCKKILINPEKLDNVISSNNSLSNPKVLFAIKALVDYLIKENPSGKKYPIKKNSELKIQLKNMLPKTRESVDVKRANELELKVLPYIQEIELIKVIIIQEIEYLNSIN